jgi:hypothetical protein
MKIAFAIACSFGAISASYAQTTQLPTWRISRDLFISASAESLDQPMPPLVTRGGTIVVADNSSGTITMFDSTGRRVSRIPARGQGPGELSEFIRVAGSIGDSVWFANSLQQRLVMYSTSG